MLDMGFQRDVQRIVSKLPKQRQSLFFSATLAQRVLELAYEHMNDPELIRIEPERVTADRVSQVIYYPSMEEKAPLLVHLLRSMEATRTMVFINTKRMADRLERLLRANGISAAAMSGDVPQRKRLRMLRDFHEGRLAVLVATDVAARGLHIPDVSHVFNYDLPQDPQDYVHRIGRTARAGATGVAVSFGCEEYVQSLPDIESFIGQRIPVAQVDPKVLPELKPAWMAPKSFGDEEGDGEVRPWERKEGGPRRGGPSRGGPSRGGRTGRPAPRAPGEAARGAPEASGVAVQPDASTAAASPPGVPAPSGESSEGAAPKRRRRRRRHGPRGPGGAPTPATPAGDA
jgi:ATP-dependent RNA helicase RhlB